MSHHLQVSILGMGYPTSPNMFSKEHSIFRAQLGISATKWGGADGHNILPETTLWLVLGLRES